MNIDTDVQHAMAEAPGKDVDAHPKALTYQLDPKDGAPQKTFYSPREWKRQAELGMINGLPRRSPTSARRRRPSPELDKPAQTHKA